MKSLPYAKYFAELLGAFVLASLVGLSLVVELPLPTPMLAAVTLGAFVYTVGPISGAHLNPAVTLGMWSIGKIGQRDAIYYMISQVVGGALAMLLVQGLTGNATAFVTTAEPMVAVVEALGAAVLAFGVAAVTYGKVAPAANGIVVGWSLFLGIMLTAGLSNGILNPAVAVGLGAVSAWYLLAPFVGGVVGAMAYKQLQK